MTPPKEVTRLLSFKDLQLTDEAILNLRSLYEKLLESRGSHNVSSLGSIFNFWLFNLQISLTYNEGIPKNTLNLPAYFYQFDCINLKGGNDRKLSPMPILWKKLIWWLLTRIPIPYGVVQGGRLGKLGWLLEVSTYYKIRFSGRLVDKEFRDEFLNKSKEIIDKPIYDLLRHVMPEDFFQIQRSFFLFPDKVYGSSSCMLNDVYLDLFFARKKIQYIVISHGGCSGEFCLNKHDIFDKDLGCKVLNWGLGEDNIRQNRFAITPLKSQLVERAVLVEAINPSKFTSAYFPGSTYDLNCEIISISELRLFFPSDFPLYCLGHPKNYKNIPPPHDNILFLGNMTKKEKECTLFVFNTPGHTCIYQAIYQCLPFVLIFDRHWNVMFTNKYLRFLNGLKKLGFFYYTDQELELNNWLQELASGKKYSKEYFKYARQLLEEKDGNDSI
jgi:hypothetical protein